MIDPPHKAATQKKNKYVILNPITSQLGWVVPIIITAGIRDTIHTTSIKSLQNLQNPHTNGNYLKNTTCYLTNIILNKRKPQRTNHNPTRLINILTPT